MSHPIWTMDEYPDTIAVVNAHPDSDTGYKIIRKSDLKPEDELFGPEGKGFPPHHIPPRVVRAEGDPLSPKDVDPQAVVPSPTLTQQPPSVDPVEPPVAEPKAGKGKGKK